MSDQLTITVGQSSDKGTKAVNQDFYGALIPQQPQLDMKGVAIAIADGVSSSDVSQIASESAVKSFLTDYFCTSDAWSVKKSAQRVLLAINSWLHAQTTQSPYRFDKDRGYLCTFSALIIKSDSAYIFHVGDTRIYQLNADGLEQLTSDHRIRVSAETSYLARALGFSYQLDIDFQTLSVQQGDIFFLATDGVYEFVSAEFIVKTVHEQSTNLDLAAKVIIDQASRQGSDDNLTAQIVRVDHVPRQHGVHEVGELMTTRPCPPVLEARVLFDGYRVVRELHASHRSHVYLATDEQTQQTVVLKTPSIDMQGDPAYLERFLMEDWIARRINNAYVLKAFSETRQRNYIYIVTEYIEGRSLRQWLIDNPNPDLETVRKIIEQIAKGLQAFHRLEMLHQDIRPDNIMLDTTGSVKIIDFGSTRVAGVMEMTRSIQSDNLLGTALYTAPEYFLGEAGIPCSDLYSLGVITYQMLSGQLPYGSEVPKTRTRAAQKKLAYRSVLDDQRDIPAWIDDVLRKAVHPNPVSRYQELSEFIHDMRHPNQAFLNRARPPLMERNPVAFWKSVSLILVVLLLALLFKQG
ncbi:MAG: bifunctional protein-serine/threonine kinase/phosphatase [Gammaproteobacteria bacterium]|nr:bifunctional protein-serine/threonine kinase/phosphatase [Gammaproteobacteria bacterium]